MCPTHPPSTTPQGRGEQQERESMHMIGVKNTFLEFSPVLEHEALRRRAKSADSPLGRFGGVSAAPLSRLGPFGEDADASMADWSAGIHRQFTTPLSACESKLQEHRLCLAGDKGAAGDDTAAETSSQLSTRSTAEARTLSWCDETFEETSAPSSARGVEDTLQTACRDLGSKDSTVASEDEDDEPKATTAMIKGIVCSLQESHVIRILTRAGFRGAFDSIHLPTNSTTGSNLGYLFVNFVCHEEYQRCVEVFHGQSFGPSRRRRGCQVLEAHTQGTLKSHTSFDI